MTTSQRTKARFEVLSLTDIPKPTDKPNNPRDRVMSHTPIDPQTTIKDIQLFPDKPEWTVKIGFQLALEIKAQLIELLREYFKVFAWLYADMSGIDLDIMSHKLNIKPKTVLVQQKRKAFDDEKYQGHPC